MSKSQKNGQIKQNNGQDSEGQTILRKSTQKSKRKIFPKIQNNIWIVGQL